jgi:chorismate mutase / prephenate dehydratase
MDSPRATLDELRRQIDTLDERLHELVMARAELVAEVAATKATSGTPALRPGREAQILRRLVGRHHGPFPDQSLVRLWRELLGGMVAMQGGFSVAVAAPPGRAGLWDLARDHFGSHLGMTACCTASEVLGMVAAGTASVGVMPMPRENEATPWWTALVTDDGIRVLARLPFAGRGNARGTAEEALVIGRPDLDPSGDDNSIVAIQMPTDPGRDAMVDAVTALGPGTRFLDRAASTYLFDLAGLVLPTDPRLAAALAPIGGPKSHIRLLGIYARPLWSEAP